LIEGKLYPIAPDLETFDEFSKYYPGIAPDERQWLIIQSSPLVCAHQFDAEGRYLGREFRTTDWADGFSWANELKLTPATIRVQGFATELGVGPTLAIRDHPRYFDEGDAEVLGPEEEQEARWVWWREKGGFVLFWDGAEYCLDSSGQRFQ
jgi:hypothetical protein